MSYGTMSMGIKCPIIRKGDDLKKIVIDSILKCTNFEEGDIIGITESIVARAQGNYITVDEIAEQIIQKNRSNLPIQVINPIYSRNRFAIILKAIARAAARQGTDIVLVLPDVMDEVGNVLHNHPFTNIDYEDYYTDLCIKEGVSNVLVLQQPNLKDDYFNIDCQLHPCFDYKTDNYTFLTDFGKVNENNCGLLGSNKVDEETIKLFPGTEFAKKIVEDIQLTLKERYNVNVEVMVYGDGCYKDPDSGIWEFADPVVSPAYTKGLQGTPNEIKLKAFADNEFKDLNGKELEEAMKHTIAEKDSNLKGDMKSQGTTPRRYVNLLGSLMDLTSGSGDKGTPIVLVRNYFKNYSNE